MRKCKTLATNKMDAVNRTSAARNMSKVLILNVYTAGKAIIVTTATINFFLMDTVTQSMGSGI